jgi:hypothetical protein
MSNEVISTLIRRVHTGGKQAQKDGNGQNVGKNNKQKRRPPFFFGK